jgi:hypothetical protein
MKKIFISAVLVTLIGFPMAQSANAERSFKFEVIPQVFIGKAGDCGADYPAGTPIVGSDWEKNLGLEDTNGHGHQALWLSKNGLTADCSAAVAKIVGVKGITLTELGFDIRNGGHCGAGAPRFNVEATDGFHFMGGCANGTQSPDTPVQGWMRVLIDPTNPAQAFPPLTPGATITSIEIVFDEGTDATPGFSGFAILDNININGTLVGQHGFHLR